MHVAAQSALHLEAGAQAALSSRGLRDDDDNDDDDYYARDSVYRSVYNTTHG